MVTLRGAHGRQSILPATFGPCGRPVVADTCLAHEAGKAIDSQHLSMSAPIHYG
jgi:hypothetical protein